MSAYLVSKIMFTFLFLPFFHFETQCRRDDLWSLLFMIIDCSTNKLPWKDDYLHMEGRPTNERRVNCSFLFFFFNLKKIQKNKVS